jgi:hypothetical protein
MPSKFKRTSSTFRNLQITPLWSCWRKEKIVGVVLTVHDSRAIAEMWTISPHVCTICTIHVCSSASAFAVTPLRSADYYNYASKGQLSAQSFLCRTLESEKESQIYSLCIILCAYILYNGVFSRCVKRRNYSAQWQSPH